MFHCHYAQAGPDRRHYHRHRPPPRASRNSVLPGSNPINLVMIALTVLGGIEIPVIRVACQPLSVPMAHTVYRGIRPRVI